MPHPRDILFIFPCMRQTVSQCAQHASEAGCSGCVKATPVEHPPLLQAFLCYQGERNLTGWPHTILLGEPNSREPEVLQASTVEMQPVHHTVQHHTNEQAGTGSCRYLPQCSCSSNTSEPEAQVQPEAHYAQADTGWRLQQPATHVAAAAAFTE
jgi:hypothetical protein